MNKFSKRDDLVLTTADKGGDTIILDVQNYVKKAKKELNNENYYKKLNHNPRKEHIKTMNNTIRKFK